jgi:hypothetical protein
MHNKNERRVVILVPEDNTSAREILIAPREWIDAIANLEIPGRGKMSENYDQIACIEKPPRDPNYIHDVILQTTESFSPTIILRAIEYTLNIKVNDVERYEYNFWQELGINSRADAPDVDSYLRKLGINL